MTDGNHKTPVNISYCAFALNFMDVRVQQPLEALRMLGANAVLHKTKVKFLDDVPEEEPKIMVLQRAFLSKEGWPKTVKAAIERGWLMVVEYDDYPENPFNAEKRANSLDWERFKMCHAIQASTKPLVKAFEEHNPEVALFENQLLRMPPPVTRTDDNIRLFFGALNRKNAWEPLIDTYNAVLRSNPKAQAVVIHDREFFDALKTRNKVFKPTADYNGYMRTLSQCDICLQPLDDTKFNRYKSDIKFLEAGAAGLAVIASPVVYEDYIDHDKTGLIARSPKEWQDLLTKLVEDAGYRKTLGANAKAYVRENRLLMQHAHKRLEWYRDLWSRKEQLNQRLFDLYPDLKP